MLKENVIHHYGGTCAVAEALGISPAAVSRWPKVIPKGRAFELQDLTKGKLRVDPTLYQKPTEAA